MKTALLRYGADRVALEYKNERNVRRAEHIQIGDHVRATIEANLARRQAGINAEFLRSLHDGGTVTQIVHGGSWISVRIKLTAPPHYPDGSAEKAPDHGFHWDAPRDLEIVRDE